MELNDLQSTLNYLKFGDCSDIMTEKQEYYFSQIYNLLKTEYEQRSWDWKRVCFDFYDKEINLACSFNLAWHFVVIIINDRGDVTYELSDIGKRETKVIELPSTNNTLEEVLAFIKLNVIDYKLNLLST